MGNSISEEQKKRLLNTIPVRALTQVAKNNGLSSQGNKNELVEQLATNLSERMILRLYSEFEYAGNITCHIFKTSILKDFGKQAMEPQLLQKPLCLRTH